ncbi:MAG: OmpA family protein [Bacteroidetes bacterium]|nr:OmpA family protein [Bacteroidota bacterium]
MKKSFVLLLALSGSLLAKSQDAVMSTDSVKPLKITKDHYTVSGGLLGAFNYGGLKVTDGRANTEFKYKPGWAIGAWLNVPLIGKAVSLEPQVTYNTLNYQSTDLAGNVLPHGQAAYISVPVLVKFHLGSKFALFAGPQFDFLSKFDNKNSVNYSPETMKKSSLAGTAGFEIVPHSRVSFYGRYVYGGANLNKLNVVPNGNFYNRYVQAGVKLKLFGKHIPADSDGDGIRDDKDSCVGVAGLARYNGCPIPDTDGDGLNDEVDKCPTVAGTAKYQGCPVPDRDKDGINDDEDKCPDQPGLAKYQGCPIPDTDKDGINDEEDKCPNEPGVAKYQGCPVPDKDNDGVNDDDDRCPDLAGPAENGGCPTLEASKFNASNVQFVTGSATLTAAAKKELDKAARILNEQYPQLKLEISGYTDNTGKADKNMVLSQKRAESVKAYLVKKKIDEARMTAKGYGQDQPIADNATKEGRAKNRRVEFKVSQ